MLHLIPPALTMMSSSYLRSYPHLISLIKQPIIIYQNTSTIISIRRRVLVAMVAMKTLNSHQIMVTRSKKNIIISH